MLNPLLSLLILNYYITPILSYNILISISVGTRSHVKGLFEISEDLNRRGHSTTFATQKDQLKFSDGYNATLYELPGDTSEFTEIDFTRNEEDEMDSKKTQKELNKSMSSLLSKLYNWEYPGLEKLIKENHFDVILCDFVANACQDIAEKYGIPLVVGYQATDFIATLMESYKTSHTEYAPLTIENMSFLERYQYQFLKPIDKLYDFLDLTKSIKQARERHNIKNKPLFDDNSYGLALINSFHGFETPSPLPPHYHMVGPLSTLPTETLNDDLDKFLNTHNKVLYVAFGSVANLGPKTITVLLQAIIQAIETNVLDGVIWSIGKSKFNLLPETIVPPNSKGYNTKRLLNNEYSNIRLLKWAPQYQILNHKSTKLFLTHGGTESVAEATMTGTAMICMPIFADQPRNAMKVESMGIGRHLNPKNIQTGAVIQTINTILTDKDKLFEMNLNRFKLLTQQPEQRIQQAANLIIKHIELAKICRPHIPFDYYTSIPCELSHVIHPASQLNLLKKYNVDIYLVNIGILLALSYFTLKSIVTFIKFIIKSLSIKAKLDKVE